MKIWTTIRFEQTCPQGASQSVLPSQPLTCFFYFKCASRVHRYFYREYLEYKDCEKICNIWNIFVIMKNRQEDWIFFPNHLTLFGQDNVLQKKCLIDYRFKSIDHVDSIESTTHTVWKRVFLIQWRLLWRATLGWHMTRKWLTFPYRLVEIISELKFIETWSYFDTKLHLYFTQIYDNMN